MKRYSLQSTRAKGSESVVIFQALYVGDERIEATAGQFAFGPGDVPHRFAVGPAGARMLWVLTPAGFENLVEAVSVPAEAMTLPPPEVIPLRPRPRS